MKIVVMTRGRVGSQETLKWIPDKWRPRVSLFCPAEETAAHLRAFPWLTCHVENKRLNYSEKFQYIIDGKTGTDPKVVIMDDDLYFSKYEEVDGVRKLCVIKDRNETEAMWDLMEKMLEKIPLVGVHPRMMAQNAKPPFEWNSKIVCIQGVNRDLIKPVPKVDNHPILADVELALTLLQRGLPNARITTHFVDWLPSQAPGGCDYRTAQMQLEACEDIANRFAPFAELVVKQPKTAKWLGDSRADLKVRWKDMYGHYSSQKSDLLD
jgi:hypothetical protein